MSKINFGDLSQVKGTTIPLNHYHIIAAICKKINLVSQINQFFVNSERKVSIGHVVQALIINGLGMVDKPLYLLSEFFKDKDVYSLLGPGIESNDLNDDSIARALDSLFDFGVTEIFAKVSSHALKIFEIIFDTVHLDSSSFTVYGQKYNDQETDKRAIKVTEGHSKAHRPDLKQAIVNLITTYDSIIPIWFEVLNGNSSDKITFIETIQKYVSNFRQSDPPYFIVDSALYSAENINKLLNIKWLTRVPENINEVSRYYLQYDKSCMIASNINCYWWKELSSNYGGIEQRWLLVYSQPAFMAEVETLKENIEKEQKSLATKINWLEKRNFKNRDEAFLAATKLRDGLMYHTIKDEIIEIIEIEDNKSQGRHSVKNSSNKDSLFKLSLKYTRNEQNTDNTIFHPGLENEKESLELKISFFEKIKFKKKKEVDLTAAKLKDCLKYHTMQYEISEIQKDKSNDNPSKNEPVQDISIFKLSIKYAKNNKNADDTKSKKNCEKEQKKLDLKISFFEKRKFKKEEANLTAIKLKESLEYHTIQYEISEIQNNESVDNSSENEPVQKMSIFKLCFKWKRNEEKIENTRKSLGKFMLATNELQTDKISSESMLGHYKKQCRSIERGFRFLKDPLFFTSNLFVKKPERMMALLMVMGLGLLVYALLEKHLKDRLELMHKKLPDVTRTSHNHSTIRRVFQMLDGIYFVTTTFENATLNFVTGLDERKKKVLEILGSEFVELYNRPVTLYSKEGM